MEKRILITGATGFVGRQVVQALCKANVQITAVVRPGKESFQNQPNVRWIVCSPDIFQESTEWWAQQCKGIDVVIHAAWYAEPGKYLQSPKNMNCLTGSLNLAKGATIAGIMRFVGIGACFEYDLSTGVLSIDTPLKPLTLYASAKRRFTWCSVGYQSNQSSLYGAVCFIFTVKAKMSVGLYHIFTNSLPKVRRLN